MIDYNEIKTILENDYKDCYDTISEISLDDRDKNNIVSQMIFTAAFQLAVAWVVTFLVYQVGMLIL